MTAEPILEEIETLKGRLATEADGDTLRFLDRLDSWLDAHPHRGPVVNSPEELQARVRLREASEAPPPPSEPYRICDPIIAEIHRAREKLWREGEAESLVLREEPPKPGA